MKIEPMSDEKVKNCLYKISTAPEGQEFSPEDGTLTRNYNFVNIKALTRAAQADALRQVILVLRRYKKEATCQDNYLNKLIFFSDTLASALSGLEKEVSK